MGRESRDLRSVEIGVGDSAEHLLMPGLPGEW